MDHLKKELEQKEDKEIVDKLTKPDPSMKDLADIMKHVIDHMWSEEKLAEYIHKVHDSLCANCPHVKNGEGKLSGKLIALISALVAAVVALAGAVCKMALGGAA